MKPYYQDPCVTIYHADCREILPQLGPVDHVITDPPYSKRTADGARTNRGSREARKVGAGKLIDFGFIEPEVLQNVLEQCIRITNRWVLAFGDFVHVAKLYETPPAGAHSVRIMIWDKPDGAPQFTGDRPATSFEAILLLHKEAERMRWNGGGGRCVFRFPVVKNAAQHPSEKPLPLMSELIRLFTNSGETILDPFMGSGTTLRAAKDYGRKAIGIELNERYCEIAAKRMSQEVFAFGTDYTPRGGETVTHVAHNHEIAGSIPALASRIFGRVLSAISAIRLLSESGECRRPTQSSSKHRLLRKETGCGSAKSCGAPDA